MKLDDVRGNVSSGIQPKKLKHSVAFLHYNEMVDFAPWGHEAHLGLDSDTKNS